MQWLSVKYLLSISLLIAYAILSKYGSVLAWGH